MLHNILFIRMAYFPDRFGKLADQNAFLSVWLMLTADRQRYSSCRQASPGGLQGLAAAAA